MEEILASIRRIISEDDAPTAEADGDAAVEARAPEPVVADAEPEPVLAMDDDDDVLELTDKVDTPAETVGDIDVFDKPEPTPEPVAAAPTPPPAPKPAPAPAPVAAHDDLVSEPVAVAAASAFGKLSAAVQMPTEGRTLEDVTRELLRPLLKAWLDEHLPGIVKAKVEEEVERIARTRVR
jgi:cell pole-organizing protein PopZ